MPERGLLKTGTGNVLMRDNAGTIDACANTITSTFFEACFKP